MKTKLLSFLLGGCLLALAAWAVYRNNCPEVTSPNGVAPAVHGGELNSPEPNEIPEKYRDTVALGLEFLAKQQHQDGHWEGDDGKHPVAMTGLVGLALLMEREEREGRGKPVVRDTKYAANIHKAADWLIDLSLAEPVKSRTSAEFTERIE